ncbi:MAG: hypothetical protein ACKO85_15615 [Isosphaeraceae bacterium]
MMIRRKFVKDSARSIFVAGGGSLFAGNVLAANENIIFKSIDGRNPYSVRVTKDSWHTYEFQLLDSLNRPMSGELLRIRFMAMNNQGRTFTSAGYGKYTDANGIWTNYQVARHMGDRQTTKLFIIAEWRRQNQLLLSFQSKQIGY